MTLDSLAELTKLVAKTADGLEDGNKRARNAYLAGLERGAFGGVIVTSAVFVTIYFMFL